MVIATTTLTKLKHTGWIYIALVWRKKKFVQSTDARRKGITRRTRQRSRKMHKVRERRRNKSFHLEASFIQLNMTSKH